MRMKKEKNLILTCLLCITSLFSFAQNSDDVYITVKATNSNVDEKGSRMWIFNVSDEIKGDKYSKVETEFKRKSGVKSVSYLDNELTVIALPFISVEDLEGIFRMADISLVNEALGNQSLVRKKDEQKLNK